MDAVVLMMSGVNLDAFENNWTRSIVIEKYYYKFSRGGTQGQGNKEQYWTRKGLVKYIQGTERHPYKIWRLLLASGAHKLANHIIARSSCVALQLKLFNLLQVD